MPLELRHLRAFSAVGKELHFGRAAEGLHIAQPALSRTIQQLEMEVGVPLLRRTTRSVELTEAGKAFLAETHGFEDMLEQAMASARHAARGIRGELRIAYTDFAINGRLPHFLRNFATQHPEIRLNLMFMPTTGQHLALMQRSIDIGFMIGGFDHNAIECLNFDEDEMVALLPITHPLCAYDRIDLSQLANEKFVMGNGENWAAFRNMFFAECRARGFFPNIVLEASNSEGIFGLVVAGVGITVYSSCVRNLPRQGVEVRPLKNIAAKLPVTAAWDRSNRSEVIDTFTTFLRREAPMRDGPSDRDCAADRI